MTDLIRIYHGGSVRRAAAALGMPHPTLARIAKGSVKNPRVEVLEAIARGFNVGVGWLLTGEPTDIGEGEETSRRAPTEAAQWAEIVASLKLPRPDALLVMSRFPALTVEVALSHILGYEGQHDRIVLETPELAKAWGQERAAWVRLFREWIRIAGPERVRDAVVNDLDSFRARFTNRQSFHAPPPTTAPSRAASPAKARRRRSGRAKK